MEEVSNRVRIDVDANACVGSGTCEMIDPEHFRLVDGKAQAVVDEVVTSEELDDAVADCPVRALTLRAP